MLENTFIFAILSVLILIPLYWKVTPEEFNQAPWWQFCISAAVFWGIFSTILVFIAWEYFYSYFVPGNYRLVAPAASLIIYPLWCLGLRWIALRSPLHPILTSCLLGGVQGLFEHLIAIYRLDILKVPFLESSTPIGVLIFAFFEYVVYWEIVANILFIVRRILNPLKNPPDLPGPALS